MDRLLRRVEAIAVATGSKEAQQSTVAEGEKVDKFTLLKREVNVKIREVRNSIKERDEYANSPGGKEDKTEIIRQSTLIRNQIKELQDDAKSMRNMVMEEEGKLVAKNKSSENLQNRYKMCDLIDAHIAECERWFKGLSFASVKDDPSKRALLKGSNFNDEMTNPTLVDFKPTDPTQTELEDVDGIEEWQLQIQENEQIIDSQIDQVLEGTYAISHLASQISQEYKILSEMDKDVDKQMDKTQSNLDNANEQLKKTSKIVAAKRNCCLDITLILLLIACIGFILWKYVF
ncbi:hypothetical protein TRFO_09598 [Tritrichomonas foetus]|uniref:t-SNARE coiled-coil homology domain-containing protein n=1 Tax=Tritrichomonas foetus TaxID=1144522 RepID=A0A1J4JD21_9EUKA|nr:hypothetical protein TRFO_09598 [Tritrichomonas foetus]|eukprot:OHS97066.1 hypothetical protein TRFO_09598 [Tritrichomonas foetus]